MVAEQITKLDQNEDEVDLLKFFIEHHWVFAWSWIISIHWHLQTLGRIFRKIFTKVVVQKYLLDQIWKIDVELKISNNQKIFLHKSDVEASHDIPKFWWDFWMHLSKGCSEKKGSKFMKDHFKRIKFMKNNYANKPTDKELIS